MNDMRHSRKKLNGFSLGEVLLSVAVLTVGILPVMSAMVGGFRSSLESRDIIVASGLAQEGTELVKNVKDNNVLAGNETLQSWLPETGSSWNNCRIDTDDPVFTPGENITCGTASFGLSMQSSGVLGHGSGGKFNRKIFLSYEGSGSEERVVCVSAVYWGNFVPSDMDEVRSGCRAAHECVYAESVLTPWGS